MILRIYTHLGALWISEQARLDSTLYSTGTSVCIWTTDGRYAVSVYGVYPPVSALLCNEEELFGAVRKQLEAAFGKKKKQKVAGRGRRGIPAQDP